MPQALRDFQAPSVVNTLTVAPDSSRFAAGCLGGVVIIYALESEVPILTLGGPGGAHQDDVYTVAWSPDGKWIASGGMYGEVKMWDASTGRLVGTYWQHDMSVVDLAFSPDSHCIASASLDCTVQVWDALTATPWLVYEHECEVTCVAWSHDSRHIASGDLLGGIQIWSPLTGQKSLQYTEHMVDLALGQDAEGISSLAFSSGDHVVVSSQIYRGGLGGQLLVWQRNSGQTLRAYEDESRESGWIHQGIGWISDGRVWAAMLDGSLHLVNFGSEMPPDLMREGPGTGYAACLLFDGASCLVSSREQPFVQQWPV